MFDSLIPAELRNVNIASFYPTERYIQKLIVGIDPVQDLHGYDAPWPAGGGKNKLDTYTASQTQTSNHGLDWTLTNNTFSYSGTPSQEYCSVTLSALGLSSLTLPAGSWKLFVFNSSGVISPRLTNNAFSKYITSSSTLVLTEPETFTRLVTSSLDTSEQISGSFKIMVCDATQTDPTSYSPYSNICPITGFSAVDIFREATYDPTASPYVTIFLGSTVYGGMLDVVRGVLTVIHGIVDLGVQTWTYGSGGQGYFLSNGIASSAKKPSSLSVKANIICSSYPTVTANAIYGGSLGVGLNTTPQIWLHDGIHASEDLVAGHASWLEGVQLVYELATPIEISLTPTQIATLHPGINNVWADCGLIIELIS